VTPPLRERERERERERRRVLRIGLLWLSAILKNLYIYQQKIPNNFEED
jgi:hypothetical protein